MISKQVAEHAISSSEEWERRGMFLKPMPGSLLEKLVSGATLGVTPSSTTTEWNPDAGLISTQSIGYRKEDETTISEHDALEQTLAVEVAGQIQQHFNFARNNVRPIVLQAMEKLRENIIAIPDQVEFTPKLVLVDLPKPVTDPELQDTIQDYRAVPLLNTSSSIMLGEADVKKIIEYAAPGSRGYDNDVATWMASLGEETILSMWDAVFGFGKNSSFAKLVSSPVTAGDAAMFTFAIATTILHATPAGLELTRDQITECGKLREQAALRLCYLTDEHHTWAKNQRVLLTYTNDRIRVAGPVYRDWIEHGGSNAILFGSVLSDKPVSLIPQLNEKAEEYISNWTRHNKLMTAAHLVKRSSMLQNVLYTSTMRALGSNLDIAFAHLGADATGITSKAYITATEKLKELCLVAREEEFTDLYTLVRRIICMAVFPYTSALDILKGVDDAKNDNQESTDREAALVMLVQLVTNYIRAQIEVGTMAQVN